MLDQQVAADVIGRGGAPHAEQLLTSVHDAYVPVDDHAEREQPEQQPDGNGRQLEQPVKRVHGRVLVDECAVVEVQPVLDQHVLQPSLGSRRRRSRRQLRGQRGRLLHLQHADFEVRVVHLLGDLVQLPCANQVRLSNFWRFVKCHIFACA